jgi:hypothetical protein
MILVAEPTGCGKPTKNWEQFFYIAPNNSYKTFVIFFCDIYSSLLATARSIFMFAGMGDSLAVKVRCGLGKKFAFE